MLYNFAKMSYFNLLESKSLKSSYNWGFSFLGFWIDLYLLISTHFAHQAVMWPCTAHASLPWQSQAGCVCRMDVENEPAAEQTDTFTNKLFKY